MNIKPFYIYSALFVVILIIIVLVSSSSVNDKSPLSDVPQDEIHNNIGKTEPVSPSSQNVSAEFMQMMDNLGDYVKKNPNDTVKIMEYADLLAASHKEDEAEVFYNKILEFDDTRTDVLTKIASLKYNAGNYIEAKSYIAQIIAIDSENIQAIFNLGIIEEKIGDIEAAKKQWENILTNHPNSKMSGMAKEAIERLSNN